MRFHPSLRGTAQRIHNLLLMILFLFVVGHGASLHFVVDLINHARPYLLWCFLILLVTLFRLRYSSVLWLYAGAALILNAHIITLERHSSDTTHFRLKILHINLWMTNDNHEEVLKVVTRHQPHVISFQEVTSDWLKVLKSDLQNYHFVCHELQSPFGICAAVNIPINRARVFFLQNPNVPSVHLAAKLNGQEVSLVFSHPKPPFNQALFIERNIHIDKLIERFRREEALILIGDLNITQWSPIYQRLERDLQLKNTLSQWRSTWPVANTWIPYFPFPIFQLDHILISQHFSTAYSEILDGVGSDHHPLVAEVLIPSKR